MPEEASPYLVDYFLAGHPAFKRLPPAELAALQRALRLKEYEKGEPVFEEGRSPDAVYLLKSGLIKAVKYSAGVEPFAMEIITPGQLFGMIAVMDKKDYPVSAVPLKLSEAYRIPAAAFEALLRRHPDLSREVYAGVGGHLRQAQTLRSLFKAPVEKRIAYVLYLLAGSVGRTLEIRREEIAELVGCTPETAIRTLIALRRKKLIASGWKRIAILEPERLKELSEQE